MGKGRRMTDDPSIAFVNAMADGVRIRAKAGDVLFRPGEACRGFIAIRSGCVRVSLTAASGREIVLYRVRPGQICLQTFSCLLENKSYAAEGIAEQDLDAVLAPPALFQRLLDEDGAFRAALLRSAADRFSDFEQVVQTLAFTGLAQRTAGALLRLCDAQGEVSATHEAIAAEIGSAREAVSRQLGAFAKEGLVQLARGKISLLRRDALARMGLDSL